MMINLNEDSRWDVLLFSLRNRALREKPLVSCIALSGIVLHAPYFSMEQYVRNYSTVRMAQCLQCKELSFIKRPALVFRNIIIPD